MPSTIRGNDGFDSGQRLTLMTAVNTTSGTYYDFTGIPSWAKRITVMFNGVSTSGTSLKLIQIGAGSVDATGYASTGSNLGTGALVTSSTAGFILYSNAASDAMSGTVVLTSLGGNVWVASGTLAATTTNTVIVGGTKTLSGALDRIRIYTVNGTDTFDAGSINILYE